MHKYNRSAAIDILGIDPIILPILSYIFLLLVPTQWFPHVESIFRISLPCRVIAIIVHDAAENAVAE